MLREQLEGFGIGPDNPCPGCGDKRFNVVFSREVNTVECGDDGVCELVYPLSEAVIEQVTCASCDWRFGPTDI